MADNKQIATEIVPLIGGAENVNVATNCMTRLRLTLKDNSLADLEGLKKIKGVLVRSSLAHSSRSSLARTCPRFWTSS